MKEKQVEESEKNRYHINSVIWLLTMSDIFTWGMFSVYSILIGLYLAQKLGYSPTEVVGIGAGLAWFARGVVQVPIGMLGDKIKSERDEIWLLLLGNITMGVPLLLSTRITDAWQFYILQIIFGVGSALNIVDWRKIFAKNLDRGKEGLEYAIYDTTMSFAIALMSILSGTIAMISPAYFELVITAVGALILGGNVWVLLIFKVKKYKRKKKRVLVV